VRTAHPTMILISLNLLALELTDNVRFTQLMSE